MLLSCGTLLHVTVETSLGIIWVYWDVLARISTTLARDERLIVLRLEALGELARTSGRRPLALIKHSLLRAIQTVCTLWILTHVLLKATCLWSVPIRDLRRRTTRCRCSTSDIAWFLLLSWSGVLLKWADCDFFHSVDRLWCRLDHVLNASIFADSCHLSLKACLEIHSLIFYFF